MELNKLWEQARAALRDKRLTRLVFVLGLCGIVLIGISSLFQPEEGRAEPQPQAAPAAGQYRQQLEEDLRQVVKAVTGEPDPAVMVTLEDDGRWVYAQDKKLQDAGEEESHVVLEDSGGAQRGLELTQEQPRGKGAVIVSRTAADPDMREKLVNAARTALGVPSSRVCVVEGR